MFALTWVYRFASMGGPLGGFENDEFVTLSQAQQLLLGDLPMPGREAGQPLPILLSAASLAVGGHTLLSEAILTITALAFCTAILAWLCWRATGSAAIALAAGLVQMLMAPRFYNYPKLLAYAMVVPACWWYLDLPSRKRLTVLSLAVAVAFLLRHDHGVYSAIAAAATVVMAQRNLRAAGGELARVALLTLAWLLPFAAWTQARVGVADYVRTFASFARSEVQRSTLVTPRFNIDWSMPPLIRLAGRPEPSRVNVRWVSDLTPQQRAEREEHLGLRLVEVRDQDVGNYAVADPSPSRLQQIVRDPAVADTNGIDRSTFVLTDPAYTRIPSAAERWLTSLRRYRVLPGIVRPPNAIPFLYWLMWALPVMAAAVLLMRRPDAHGWSHGLEKMLVVVLLALLVDRGFLRGNLPSRLADVSEVTLLLAAWLTAAATSRRLPRGRRAIGVGVAALAWLLTIASVSAIENMPAQVGQAHLLRGVDAARAQASAVYRLLNVAPPVAAFPRDMPGTTAVARYVNACTRADDRLLVLNYQPEVFFVSARGFVGQVWIQPNYFTSDADQQAIIDHAAARRVPIVLTVPEPAYSDDYVESFPRLDGYLRSHYAEAGTVDFGAGVRVRLLVARGLQPTGRYGFANLPCFA